MHFYNCLFDFRTMQQEDLNVSIYLENLKIDVSLTVYYLGNGRRGEGGGVG